MRKKYVVEFGRRGGCHTDNMVVTSEMTARRVVANFVRAVDPLAHNGCAQSDWFMLKGVFRKSWQNVSYFAAISLLDGVDRGSAAEKLWKVGPLPQGFKVEQYDSRF